jgi:hypothetical protein
MTNGMALNGNNCATGTGRDRVPHYKMYHNWLRLVIRHFWMRKLCEDEAVYWRLCGICQYVEIKHSLRHTVFRIYIEIDISNIIAYSVVSFYDFLKRRCRVFSIAFCPAVLFKVFRSFSHSPGKGWTGAVK